MTTATPRRAGQIFDFGPDGLGFIIPADEPDSMLAFTFPRGENSLGIQEGDRVTFQLNDRGRVSELKREGSGQEVLDVNP